MKKFPMTVSGAKYLKEELDNLKSVQRPNVIAAIAEARAHGDLKENAEYHAARERQSFIEGRIIDIEAKLSNAQVIDISKMENTGKVIFGTTITLYHIENAQEVTYQLVGEDEADVALGKISVTSPIARAMIGKSVGDEVDVSAPHDVITYEILDVKY